MESASDVVLIGEDREPVQHHDPVLTMDRQAEVHEVEGLWKVAERTLRDELRGNFSAWFARTKPVALDGDSFVLAVPSLFVKEWIEDRYTPQLRAATSMAARRDLSIALVVDESLSEAPDAPEVEDPPGPGSALLDPPPAATDSPPQFHPKYSFESFVIGSSNRFAHAAALAVAEAPAEAYNPLFIYGAAGLGKTHLLHAIGRYARDWHRGSVVRYVSTEQFMNDFIEALQRRSIRGFHQRYRAADLLLIDDIQFLEGKERTQEEFFHTFNALHPKSQIVITSDRPPKKIPTLEERLRTRFEWGLITDIQPPDLETRLAILRRKTETERLAVPPEVMSYIASRIQTNIRELEGALIRVAAYASLTRSSITLEGAQGVLQSLLPNTNEARVTSDLIISVAADYFDVTPEEICSPSRSRPLVNARQMAMYLCRELTDLSLPKIGERFGGRDHSTVVFAVNKVRQHMQERESWFEQVRELTTRIRQQAARG
ncbi:MAG: chromosomal replication initiator protein DnaA [Actinomycetota bacterium]|nr:chromosomal replication initiator protein DnaA [Actinomycetota bacterium]